MLHKDRISTLFLGPGTVSIDKGSLLYTNKDTSSQIPAGQFSAIFLEPGTSVTHAAVKLCAEQGCSLHWVGEEGVRFYSAGLSKTARVDRLWCQAEQVLNKSKRLSVARRMYSYRFGNSSALKSYTLEQLSGMEAVRVKEVYQNLAIENNLVWEGRSFKETESSMKARVNLCISTANSCLYGLAYAAIIAAGYSPALGFIHGRTSQSFVFDVADLVKFKTVTKVAFAIASDISCKDPARETRIVCRDLFHKEKMVDTLIEAMDYTVGFNMDKEYTREAILPPFKVWNYARDIIKQDTP